MRHRRFERGVQRKFIAAHRERSRGEVHIRVRGERGALDTAGVRRPPEYNAYGSMHARSQSQSTRARLRASQSESERTVSPNARRTAERAPARGPPARANHASALSVWIPLPTSPQTQPAPAPTRVSKPNADTGRRQRSEGDRLCAERISRRDSGRSRVASESSRGVWVDSPEASFRGDGDVDAGNADLDSSVPCASSSRLLLRRGTAEVPSGCGQCGLGALGRALGMLGGRW
ncbi:uncharacterized protein B0H18DRAFT_52475 [Fomitopsis serialis]|uniref:uncharacterized protein n=1 Tax=Fomitopsis serialis TaxID=139415 RepID=UPI002007C57A|nr:uncharacterized protein B0H18DRAFT_52475 [Neoantrodia serialis]KAH9932283.1 hypothetical protein B0H18DRAFT_52475 [Neoantrodia serialis]